MKHLSLALAILVSLTQRSRADLVPGGDFQMYKPGTNYAVTATFSGTNPFARGVGDGINLAGGIVTYSDASLDGVSGDGNPDIDLPGWVSLQSGNDLVPNGVGGSTGMNLFAAWGGDGRIQSAESLGTITSGSVYTIRVMVGGPDSGPIQGPLAFHLAADGVQMTPSAQVDPTLPNGGAFQEISRTYDAASIADHIGAEMTIVLGVEDANDFANRVIFDDVSLDVESTGPAFVFAITNVVYNQNAGTVQLTWTSKPNTSYIAKYSLTMADGWPNDMGDGLPTVSQPDEIPGDGDMITITFDLSGYIAPNTPEAFFRIEEQ